MPCQEPLFGLPTWTRVAALIAEHPGLQDALGGYAVGLWACYRFTKKLRTHKTLLDPIGPTLLTMLYMP